MAANTIAATADGDQPAGMKFLHLNFVPRSADAGLLLLRLWFGGSLLLLHGWLKLTGFSSFAHQFIDPFGIGKPATLSLAIFGEVICATLVVLGLFTRVASLGCAITMAVAFWFAHGAKLSGPTSGEMAFLFGGAFLALFAAGAGAFSLDAKMGAKS
jgi:putative oxidoreductase